MLKRLTALLLTLSLLLTLMPTIAEDGLDLDALMQDIELEEQANGLSAKRFTESLTLLPEKTALYTDEALEDLFGTLNKEAIAYVIERKEGEVPEEDTLLVAVAVKGSMELLYCLAGEAVALTPDEANTPGTGYQVPGTNVWLSEADIALADRPEQEEVPVDEIEVPDFIFDDLFDQTEVLDQDDKATVQIITQPTNQVRAVGEYVTVSVTANGVKTYQWQWSADGTTWKNNTGAGYNKASMTFKMTAAFSGRQYRCKLTGDDGSIVYSNSAYVGLPLSITTQPATQVVKNGETVTLNVEATGVRSYQWQYSVNGSTWNNNTSAGYNQPTFTFKMSKAQNSRQYRCMLTGFDGETLATEPASVFNAMTIVTQPESQSLAVGDTVMMYVGAVGVSTYQWQYTTNGETWINNTGTGYNKATFTFKMSRAQNGRQYRCMLTDADGSVLYTKPALLCLGIGIVTQPQSQSVKTGSYVTLSVEAVGVQSYQWQWTANGVTWTNNTGAGYNKPSMVFKMTASFVGRQYRCMLTGEDGSVLYTNPATLYTGIAVMTQPETQILSAGETVTLSVKALGVSNYQWQYSTNGTTWTNNSSAGYNKPDFSFKMSNAQNGRQYRCMLSDEDGNIEYSDPVYVYLKLSITAQPQDLIVKAGAIAALTVSATGVRNYQWQYSTDGEIWIDNSSTGCNAATLSFTMSDSLNGRQFRCKLEGYDGSTGYTTVATVYKPLTILSQPEPCIATAGDTVSFSVEAKGVSSYQWQWTADGTTWKNNTGTGYNKPTFSFGMSNGISGRQYRCQLTDADGNVAYTNAVVVSLPLAITIQPENQVVKAGDTVTLTVTAVGVKAYQWQYTTDGTTWRNNGSAGNKTAVFSFAMSDSLNGRRFRCRLTGHDGTTQYTNVVDVYKPLTILTQPQSQIAALNSTVTVSVEARGVSGYQWQWTEDNSVWNNCTSTGYNNAAFSFKMTEAVDRRQYRCLLTAEDGSTGITDTVILSLPLAITTQPQDQLVKAGRTVTLSVRATGVQSYQWQFSTNGTTWKNNSAAGCKTADFSFAMAAGLNGRQFRCCLTGRDGTTAYSDTVVVYEPLTIFTQPVSQQVEEGETITLIVEAIGVDAYQWQYSDDGVNWHNVAETSSTDASYSFAMSDGLNGRLFRCRLTDDEGAIKYTDVARATIPLSITVQPETRVFAMGQTATLSIGAKGVMTYCWQTSADGETWADSEADGHGAAALSFPMTEAVDGHRFRCVLTAYDGTVLTSDTAIAALPVALKDQSSSQLLTVGDPAVVSVTAVGVMAYLWQYSDDGRTWSANSSADSSTAALTFAMTESLHGRQFRCRITGYDSEIVYSERVTLTATLFRFEVFGDTEPAMHITGYVGNESSVVIPEELDGIPVTAIGPNAFKDSAVTSVTISEGVTAIGSKAFANCSLDVTFADSINSIATDAFANANMTGHGAPGVYAKTWCEYYGYEYICLSSPASDFSWQTFNGNKIKITGYNGTDSKIYIPSEINGQAVVQIASTAFAGKTSITYIAFPESVMEIEAEAFEGCSSLFKVIFSEGLTEIKNWTFYNATLLQTVVFPSTLTTIGEYAFCNCTSLTAANLPGSVTTIGNYAFAGCSLMESFHYPLNLTNAGDYIFENCSSLASVIIPEGVTKVADNIFYYATGLTSVTFPSTLTEVGSWAFGNCTSLATVQLPSSVTTIGEHAFCNCTSLTSLYISPNVTILGDYIFDGCDNLTIRCRNGSTIMAYCIHNDIPYQQANN